MGYSRRVRTAPSYATARGRDHGSGGVCGCSFAVRHPPSHLRLSLCKTFSRRTNDIQSLGICVVGGSSDLPQTSSRGRSVTAPERRVRAQSGACPQPPASRSPHASAKFQTRVCSGLQRGAHNVSVSYYPSPEP